MEAQKILKSNIRVLHEESHVVKRTYRTATEVTIDAPEHVVAQLPRFVSFYDAHFSVQKQINGDWVYGEPAREQYKDPTCRIRGGEVCGHRVALPEAGTYRFIWEWHVYSPVKEPVLPIPVALDIAGRHPSLKAFNVIELGTAVLFERFDPRWLMYGQYEYLVQLKVPPQFDDNIHIHFGTALDILLRGGKQDQNTWLNVFVDGATLLIWDKATLDLVLAACEATVTSCNPDHRVDAEVTALVRPEAVWSPLNV